MDEHYPPEPAAGIIRGRAMVCYLAARSWPRGSGPYFVSLIRAWRYRGIARRLERMHAANHRRIARRLGRRTDTVLSGDALHREAVRRRAAERASGSSL